MGFFSKVWKGIKKGVKKVFKGVKKVVSKAWKEVKRFAKSDLGKIVIAAAAIYFGGQALNWWGTGASGAGAGTGTALTQSTVPGSLKGVAISAGDVAAMGGTEAMIAEQALMTSAQQAGGALAAGEAGKQVVQKGLVDEATKKVGEKVVEEGIKKGAGEGFWGGVKDYGSKALDWMSENPALTLAGGQALTAALAPDPYEEWVKQQEYARNNANRFGIYGDGSGRTVGLGLVSRARNQAGDQLQASTVPGQV